MLGLDRLAGDRFALTTERWAARRPEHLWAGRLTPPEHMPLEPAWREDDDSPVLETFLKAAEWLPS